MPCKDAPKKERDQLYDVYSCMNKVESSLDTPEGICNYLRGTYACYPKCYCEAPAVKAMIEQQIKDDKADSGCKDVVCGSAGLRAGAFSVFVAAVVALVAAH